MPLFSFISVLPNSTLDTYLTFVLVFSLYTFLAPGQRIWAPHQAGLDERNQDNALTASTGKSKIIDTIGGHVGDASRPALFASSSKRGQRPLTPPRPKAGSNGSSYSGCARNGVRRIDRSRHSVPMSQYEPNDSARVGEGRLVQRGRVLSQSHFVAWERRRRELGSNLVIVTTTLTSGEGHVVDCGDSQRVRKISAGVPASVPFRGQVLALILSRAERLHWTAGSRPIHNYDLRSLRRSATEAQIQDRSRQKTGLNTVPGFSRVYPSFPRTRGPREKQSTPFTAPSRSVRGRVRSERGIPRAARGTPSQKFHTHGLRVGCNMAKTRNGYQPNLLLRHRTCQTDESRLPQALG